MKFTHRSILPISILLALLLSGCAGSVKNMQEVSEDMAVTAPEEGKSLVVFMRPSGIGFAIQSSVFAIVNEQPELVGIVAAKKRVAYQTEPGEHLFMVVGESSDFMSAELIADKTYYALVTPRLGVWKARFSLKPIHRDELDTPMFNEWLNDCQWVETTDDSEQWAREHMDSIKDKYLEYYPQWRKKAASSRPALAPEDGM